MAPSWDLRRAGEFVLLLAFRAIPMCVVCTELKWRVSSPLPFSFLLQNELLIIFLAYLF